MLYPSPRVAVYLFGLFLAALAGYASAGSRDEPVFKDRFQLRLGAFLPRLDSTVENSGERSRGDRLDFESDLGLDDSKTTFYGGASWRFARRHMVEIEYFDLARNGRESNDRAWTIGDKTLLVGGQVDSKFDVQVTRISYQYTLIDRESQRLNIQAGIHHAELEAYLRLAGEVLVDEVPVVTPPGKTLSELSKTDVPLPHFGLSYGYSWAPDWSLHASAMAFSMSYDQYEGALLELNLSAQYQINRHVGVGGGVKYFKLDVDREKKGNKTEFDFEYVGPAIFITATF